MNTIVKVFKIFSCFSLLFVIKMFVLKDHKVWAMYFKWKRLQYVGVVSLCIDQKEVGRTETAVIHKLSD